MEHNYIYLNQEREFLKTKENVYKLGKTRQENTKRFSGYPKGTRIIIMRESIDCDLHEKELLKIFKETFKHRSDYGAEYFQGDRHLMVKTINTFLDAQKFPDEDAELDQKISEEKTEETILERVVNKYSRFLEDDLPVDKITKKKLENKDGYSLSFKEKRECSLCDKEHGNQRLDIFYKNNNFSITCYKSGISSYNYRDYDGISECSDSDIDIDIVYNNCYENFWCIVSLEKHKDILKDSETFKNYYKKYRSECVDILKSRFGPSNYTIAKDYFYLNENELHKVLNISIQNNATNIHEYSCTFEIDEDYDKACNELEEINALYTGENCIYLFRGPKYKNRTTKKDINDFLEKLMKTR